VIIELHHIFLHFSITYSDCGQAATHSHIRHLPMQAAHKNELCHCHITLGQQTAFQDCKTLCWRTLGIRCHGIKLEKADAQHLAGLTFGIGDRQRNWEG